MSVAGPGYLRGTVTNRTAAGRQVTVKVRFTVPPGDEHKLTVARQGMSATDWTPVALTGSSHRGDSVVTGVYRLTVRKGANPFALRVAPGFKTTQPHQELPVSISLLNAKGKTLSEQSVSPSLDLVRMTASPTPRTLNRSRGWNETTIALANASTTDYRALTVRAFQSCYGPNSSDCPKSSFRLERFTNGQWRPVRTYIPPRKPGVEVDKETVVTRIALPVGARRTIRLRLAATSTARPGSTGDLYVHADNKPTGEQPWVSEDASTKFTIH
ncbi:hypothetical protein G3I40_00075 [Streptomyces sp. SID14478]|uniref:hypothetical protein n=1 Tax=Streptomyces sp. SID14478 TaxID=2706073 RepID=UPI0013DAC043|nr:hypothetical protein [Streptomyces sp. SID14478]NEB73650.1 hypothetical protein [Streptomyces sp. SID14478]